MSNSWILLYSDNEQTYFKMHERLTEKYARKLRNNPNRVRYEYFDLESEIDNEIRNLIGRGFVENKNLENLAFDWNENR